MSAIHLTAENFKQEILEAQTPAVVDFWAEWCGPCKMMGPILDEAADALSGKAKVAKVNVDQAQDLALEYNVMSIPTLVFFKQGKVVDQSIGVISKEQLLERVQKLL